MSGYERTSEQIAVIEHPLVPLRVAAGAGTGKTATMADRLVRVVSSGVPPEATLGLTFTNKAAEELADRLRASLSEFSAEGREVEVATYHGFAHGILEEYGVHVGIERDAKIIGPGFVRQLLAESIPLGSYEHLDMSAPAQRVTDAAHLAGQLGSNLLSTEDLLDAIPVPARDPWPARRELAGIVARYETAKASHGVLDYADLICSAHRLVTRSPRVAAQLRERYRFVVLDEYQDADPAQRELIRTLFGAGFPVTAVGDSDQMIYEWRGASTENFEDFAQHFPSAEGSTTRTLYLTVNHRSSRLIVDVANAVRSQLRSSSDLTPLRPADNSGPGKVVARWFRTALDEAVWIASEARRLHADENIAWKDMAVLFRKNRHVPLVRDAFALEGIPVEVASLGGLLEVPEVADLLAWLRILHDPEDVVSLVRILTGSRYRLGLVDIARLVRWGRRGGARPNEDGPSSWPLLAAIDGIEEIDEIDPDLHGRISELRDTYRSLLTLAQSVALGELCRQTLDALDAWHEIEAMEPASSLSARLNLYRFFDLAEGWSPLQGRPSLAAFLDYLRLLGDDGAFDELDTARVGGNDAVTLLTVHRAKGLEWGTVFLPALATGVFPAHPLRHDNPAVHAHSLPYELRLGASSLPNLDVAQRVRSSVLRDRHLEGEWRTAYVAVTRAGTRLYPTGAYWYGGTRPLEPSALYEIATGCDGVVSSAPMPEPGAAPGFLGFRSSGAPLDPLFAGGWANALRNAVADPGWVASLTVDRAAYDDRVNQLRLMVDGLPDEGDPASLSPVGSLVTSVTGLVTLAVCPARFYWTDIEPLPRRPSEALQRGVKVHHRIELHNRGVIAFDEAEDDLYDSSRADTGRDKAAPDPFAVFLKSRFADRTPRFIEAPIDLAVGGTRVRGRIDAIYESEDGQGWEIVDYKSGRYRDDPTAVVQLQAYAVAAKEGAIGTDVPDELCATFLYLGGNEPVEATYVADDAWLESATQKLERLALAAMGTEFAAEPSAACRSCDFARFCEEGKALLAG